MLRKMKREGSFMRYSIRAALTTLLVGFAVWLV